MWGLFLLDYGKAPRRAARKPPDRALIDPFLLFGCPAVHDSHKGLAPAAQNFRQQDAGHGPDTGEVVQDDEGGDDARPEAVQRRLGQQHESLEHQRGGVDEDTARVDMHPDHAVGIHGAESEHQPEAEEGRIGRTHRTPPLDEEVVHEAVADGTGHHGDHAALGLLIHDIDAVHELIEAAAGRRQHEERHEVPCVIVVGLHDVHDRAAEPDDARCTAEQHAGIGAEDLGKELGSPLFLGDSRQLPCVVEDKAQRREDGRQEVAGGEQAAPCVAAVAVEAVAHLTHKEQIGCVDDPEAYLGRYHGQREVEHLLPEGLVDALQLDEIPELAGEHQEEHAHEVAADDGQQIAVGTPLEAHQIEHIKRHGRHGAEHAVHGHQLVPLAAAHELGAEGAQAAHQDVNINKQAVLSHIGQKLRHRPAEHEDAEAAEDGEQAVGEHLLFAVALIEAEADDGVGHAHRHKGDEQVGVLAQNLRQAEIGDLGHRVRQERLDDERQQLGRKAADGKDDGIAGELRIFIAAGGLFAFQKIFSPILINPAGLSSPASVSPLRPRKPGCGWAAKSGSTHALPHRSVPPRAYCRAGARR